MNEIPSTTALESLLILFCWQPVAAQPITPAHEARDILAAPASNYPSRADYPTGKARLSAMMWKTACPLLLKAGQTADILIPVP